MAEENDTNSSNEFSETDATSVVPAAKKQRAARRSKSVIEAASSSAAPKSRKARAKRGAQDTKSAATVEPKVVAAPASKRSKAVPADTANTLPSASDDFAELLRLEEENKGLRKALAEKLRAENADLRKRLG